MNEEKWASEAVKDIISDILNYKEAKERGYTELDFENFAALRSIDQMEKPFKDLYEALGASYLFNNSFGLLEFLKKNPKLVKDNKIDVKRSEAIHYNGRTDSEIIRGVMSYGDTNNLFIPISFQDFEFTPKKNKDPRLDDIEFRVMQALANDPLANFASVVRLEDGIGIEQLKEPSLFDLTYYDFMKENYEELLSRYKELINESTHITSRLTHEKIITDDIKNKIFSIKYNNIIKKHNINIKEAEKKYFGYKLMDCFCLDESFLKVFQPIQNIINDYALENAVWISDRSPKNRKEKNFDANKIDYAPLTRELTLVIDMPLYFSHEKRLELLEEAVKSWNTKSNKKIEFNDEFMKSYYAESFVRAVINANHSLNEAMETIIEKQGTPFYFEYAKLVYDAYNYLGLGNESLNYLIDNKNITLEQAKDIGKYISDSFDKKKDFVDYKDLKIDLRLYTDVTLPWHVSMRKLNPKDKDLSQPLIKQYAE